MSIGNFDGVHRGHQEVIRTLSQVAKKNSLKSAILTFEPHPKRVLFNPDFRTLQDIEEKCSIISLLKIDILISHPFTKDFSKLSPREFTVGILKQRLNVSHVVVGSDFCCGNNLSGRVTEIKEIFKENHIEIIIVPPYVYENKEVHTSFIRDLIQNGQVAEANKFLFSPYSLSGQVVHGKCRGTELGFPTINIYNDKKVIPAKGVYATRVLFNGAYYDSVTNIGICPTFGKEKLKIETHLLDFNQNIYSKYVQLVFFKRLRNEQKFESKESLIEEIKRDIKARKELHLDYSIPITE